MGDLISRSALIAYMCGHCGASCNLEDECCANVDAVENAPSVDAVEVVRCKDCKFWEPKIGFCDKHSQFDYDELEWDVFEENDFCSYGERKSNEKIND